MMRIDEIVVYDKIRLAEVKREALRAKHRYYMLQAMINGYSSHMRRNESLLVRMEESDKNFLKKDYVTVRREETKKTLHKAIKQANNYIINMQQSQLAVLAEMEMWEQEANTLENYFESLRRTPVAQYKNTYAAIWDAINAYENTHSLGQSVAERIFWREIKTDLLNLDNLVFSCNEGEICQRRAHVGRCKFAAVCGFLWFLEARMQMLKDEKKVRLAFPIYDLINMTHVGENKDLPQYGVGMTCLQFYISNRQPAERLLENELLQLELADYEFALSKLKNNITGEISEVNKAQAIVASIEKQVASEFLPNRKFYTLILNLVCEGLRNEANADALATLKNLITAMPGAPSKWNYIANGVVGTVAAINWAVLIYAYFWQNEQSRNTNILSTAASQLLLFAARRFLPCDPTGVALSVQEAVDNVQPLLSVALR